MNIYFLYKAYTDCLELTKIDEIVKESIQCEHLTSNYLNSYLGVKINEVFRQKSLFLFEPASLM